jgi:hypothetical protein
MRLDPAVKQQFGRAFAVLVVFLGTLWAIGLIRPF